MFWVFFFFFLASSNGSGLELEYPCLPTINSGLSEHEQQRRVGQLRKEDKAIRSEFSRLTQSLCQFVQNIPLNNFKCYVKSFDGYKSKDTQVRLLTDRFEEIDKCKTTGEVLVILAEYYSWFNTDIIEDMIVFEYNTSFEFSKKWKKYEKKYKKYLKRRLFEFPNKISSVSQSGNILYLKMGAEPQNKKDFESKISDLMEIEQYVLKLVSISPGCVQLVFSIPSAIAKAVFPLSSSQEKELLSLNVQKLSCNGYNFDAEVS